MTADNLADLLVAHKEAILRLWASRVRSDAHIPQTDELSESRLRDHLPVILDEIAEILHHNADPERAGRSVARSGTTLAHAHQRFDDDYDLKATLRELAVLRVVIIEYCDSQRLVLQVDASVTLHAAIDQVMATSALEMERLRMTSLREKSNALASEAELRERFMGILGHDLRSPLQTVQLGVEAIINLTKDVAIVKLAQRVGANGARMARMIEQLLDFTEMRAGTMPIRRGPCDLAAIAQEGVASLRMAAPDRQITVALEGDTTGAWDADRVMQVITNLVRNAIEHGAPNAPIEVGINGLPTEARIRVHNMGHPIPAELLETIFQAFRRTRDSEGLGLGLHIVQQIARAHGGEVAVSSTPEVGTTFVVTLPRESPSELAPDDGPVKP